MNLIDHWKDFKIIVDTLLILVGFSFDIYEIIVRSQNQGYYSGASTFVLNTARLIRSLMLQRRSSNFLAKLKDFYQSKKIKKQLKRRNSVTDMLNELLLFIGKDELFLK